METNNKKKILIVDDNEGLKNVLIDKFNYCGFEAIGAEDGQVGLEKALELHPDIILLDVVMPKMGGMEVLKELRKDGWGKNVKVMILTLVNEPEYMADAVESNILGYFVKTEVNLDKLVDQIKRIFEIKT